MSTLAGTRSQNERLALLALLRGGLMSRADLARELGVTRSTASTVVAALMADGLVVENTSAVDHSPARTGRPGSLMGLEARHSLFLGVDIAIDGLRIAALDLCGECRFLDTVEISEATPSPEGVVSQVGAAIRHVLSALPGYRYVQGVNVTVPGLVDLEGNVVRAPLLGWRHVPLGKLLQGRLEGTVFHRLDNDAKAFALADLRSREIFETRHAVYLFLDEGVGGCVVSHGRVLRGHHGHAGEIGHIVVGEGSFGAPTTMAGTLESFTARRALLHRYHHHLTGGDGVASDRASPSLAQLQQCLRQGEPAATAALADCVGYLGKGLATIASLLNPERIILGGPVASLYALCHGQVIEAMRDHLPRDSDVPDVDISSLGRSAPAMGAALMRHREFFALPT